MPDNVTANPGSGGPTFRTKDRAGIETPVTLIDKGGASESLVTDANPLGVTIRRSDGTEIGTAGSPLRVDPAGSTAQPATIADGASAALGAKADTQATDDTGSWSVVALLKRVAARLASILAALPATLSNGNLRVSLQETTVTQNVDLVGGLTPRFAAIAASASGDNQVVPAVTGKKLRVLGYLLVTSGPVTARFRHGSTDLTGAMPLLSNDRLATSLAHTGWFETAAGVALQLNLSAAVGVAGHMVYVEA